jgi:hypothetical protein
MYDLLGADEGREWIEIQNTGTEAVDISGWKLFEEGVSHRLIAERGSFLSGGAYAIIADDAQKFSADWPNYRGMLLSSSFTLKNKGETLAIKNASSTIVASHAYASDAGGQGNGNTLNLISGAFVERAPSPGAAPSPALLSVKTVSDDSAELPSGDAGVVSIKDSDRGAGAFGSFQDGAFSGMIPWILALLGVVLIGGCAIFFVKKEPTSGYKIIEENDG